MSNILKAISHIEETTSTQLDEIQGGANRINSIGEGLEVYIKKAFSNMLNETDSETIDEAIENVFSYLGNANNIPDAMVNGGDAIEVKKIQNFNAGIALNSSYPKDKLYADDQRINKACRAAEEWGSKDIIYAIGVVPQAGALKHLWLIYGDCYAANKETYTRIGETIKNGVEQVEGVEFSPTKELGRVNAVDPLGITYLRIRGMWHIDNPTSVYETIYPLNRNLSFSLSSIMLKEKFDSFPEVDKEAIRRNPNINLQEKRVKNPNNPAERLDVILITIEKE